MPKTDISCLLLSGETTVTVNGSGLGGRNTELTRSMAIHLGGQTRCCLPFFAIDEEDGSSPAAGAIVTGDTLARAESLGIDPEV